MTPRGRCSGRGKLSGGVVDAVDGGALIPERMGGNGDERGSEEGAVTPKAAGRNLFDDVTGLAPRAGAV